eukprot:gb/GECG01014210.1/.p1 GENE.gb/GECG01014210.1/~~gb/GECG01014210.1/.p1  ORF type:complete len:572 (+),score=35.20 gb/GECG01014210.1/:1-1716(+)
MAVNVLSSLATALFSTYLLIILGFVIVKLDIIRQADVSTGIGKFTGLIALPTLLFRSIATINLGGINWNVVAGVALAKVTIFFLVALFSLLIDRTPGGEGDRKAPEEVLDRDPEDDMEELNTIKEEKEYPNTEVQEANYSLSDQCKNGVGEEDGYDTLEAPLLSRKDYPQGTSTDSAASLTNKASRRRWAEAGIRAIFVVQSNDLALGLPLMSALYAGTDHTDFVHYQYILTTIALVTTNPVGFFMIEYGLHRGKSDEASQKGMENLKDERGTSRSSRCHPNDTTKFVLKILFNVLRNPIVLSVILGVLWNQAARRPIPDILDQFLKMLGNSFDACALFTLGSSMVNRLKRITQLGIAYPMSLILSKTLLLPILCKVYLAMLSVGPDLSLYGFIYGTLPTAPVVFLWAQQFGLESEVIASVMVAGTIVFAPVLFLAANVLTLSNSNSAKSKGETTTAYAVKYISPCSLVFVVCLLLILSYSWYLRRSRTRSCGQLLVSTKSTIHSSMSILRYISPMELLIAALGVCYFISTIAVLACQDSIHDKHYTVRTPSEIARFFFLYCSVLGKCSVP